MKLATALRAFLVAAALWASLAVPTPAPAQFQNACTSLPCSSVDVNFTDNWYWVQGTGYVSYATLFSHARASAESCTSPAGVVTYVTANNPCLTNGLAIWQGATNLVVQSQALGTTPWATTNLVGASAPTVTQNLVLAPDGTLTGTQIALPAVTAGQTSAVFQNINVTASTVYQYSIWLRGSVGGEVNYISWNQSSTSQFVHLKFTLTNQWQRFTFSVTPGNTAISAIVIGPDLRDGGQTTTAAQTIYAWGGQFEASSTATPYIPTTTTTAARAADVVKAAGAFLTTMQSAQGSITVSHQGTLGSPYLLYAGGNNLVFGYDTNTLVVAENNAGQFLVGTFGSGGFTTGAYLGASWDSTGRSLAANAGTVVTDTNAPAIVGVNLYFGSASGTGQFLNSNANKLTAWGYRISNAQLNVVTSGTPANWVLSGASFDSDFTRGLYWSATVGYVPYSTFYTHTRASSETCTNSLGVITYATNGLPCQTNLGLAVWEARTNLCLHSQDTTGWGVGLGALTGNVSAAPDGATTASLYTENTSSGQHTFFSAGSTTVADSIYTISVYVKYSGRRYVVLSNGSTGVDWYAATFDLLTGTITQANGAGAGTGGASTVTASSITPTINGYRLSVTGSIHLTITYIQVFPSTVPTFSYGATGSPAIYTGDGSSGVYWWGGQIELGSFPSPYIPTTTGTATRAADNITLASALLTPMQGAQASAAMKYNVASPTAGSGPAGLSATPLASFLGLDSGSSKGDFYVGITLLTTNTWNVGADNKQASSWGAASRAISMNGVAPSTDTNVLNWGLTTTVFLGDFRNTNSWIDGNIKRFPIYTSQLSSAALQALTNGNW